MFTTRRSIKDQPINKNSKINRVIAYTTKRQIENKIDENNIDEIDYLLDSI